MRAALVAVVLALAARAVAADSLRAPGPRLPDGVDPVAYDLTLAVDPARDAFHGRVEIRARIAMPSAVIWFHASRLEIERATVDGAPVAIADPADAGDMRALVLPRARAGEVSIVFDYTGHVDTETGREKDDAQGLFREQRGGRWYLFSQGESVFARRIAPCLDEPRWKVPWRVSLVVPRGQVALANAPEERSIALGPWRAVQFQTTPPLASYLVAIAVGPFALVDAGRVGRAKIPARFAVAREDAAGTRAAVAALPKLVDAVEQYTGAPLPWPKLDLIAVPTFFGGMENPGLITLERETIAGAGDARGGGRSQFLHVVGHELAHLFFGDAVTPAWWSDLWLSEAFATWLEARISAQLGGRTASALERHDDRARALAADGEPGAGALRRDIRSGADAEEAFGAIAYEKGAAVLATFERFAGPDKFQGALRAYLARFAGKTATTSDFIGALSERLGPELANALRSYVERAGAPVVALERRCPDTGQAMLVAEARGGFTVPVCARTPAGTTCALAGAHAEIPLGDACPPWIVGNAGGLGYYQVVWMRDARPPLDKLEPAELLAAGDDLAAAVVRGDLAASAALAEVKVFAASKQPYAQLSAIAIANVIDPIVGDAERPAWQAWIAARFPDRVTERALAVSRGAEVDERIVERVVAFVSRAQLAPAAVARARRSLGGDGAFSPWEVRVGGTTPALLDRLRDVLESARPGGKNAEHGDEIRDGIADVFSAVDVAFAPAVVDQVIAEGDRAAQLWPGLAHLLRRTDARSAAWVAVKARASALFAALQPAEPTALFTATSALCSATERADVAAVLGPLAARATGGPEALAAALASIDRCVARRAAARDLAAALR